MTSNTNLTEEQKKEIHQLEFYYREASNASISASDADLFKRVVTLDNNLKRRAFARAFAEGIFGFLLLITGYNFLTILSHAFLAGIVIFCVGAIILASSYPLYNLLLHKSRKKYAPVVLTVTTFLG